MVPMKWLILFSAVLLFIFWDQSYTPNEAALETARATAASHCAIADLPTPDVSFSTDACSFWPNSMAGRDWGACCVAHDAAYWCGGTAEMKAEADRVLRECIETIQPGMGYATWAAFKATHHSYLPLPWRWGNAYPYSLETAPF